MEEGRIWAQILTAVFLGICGAADFKSKRIRRPVPLIFAAGMLLFHVLLRDTDWLSLFGGSLVGLGLLAAARLTGEAIGYGDGLTVAACGAAVGFAQTFCVFALAVCLAAVWSAILLLFKKAGRKDAIPFVPFLFAAQICVMAGVLRQSGFGN